MLAHIAGVLAGVSVAPVKSHLTASEAAFILGDAGGGGGALVLVGPETAAVAADALTALRAAGDPLNNGVVAWRSQHPGTRSFDEWVARASGREASEQIAPVHQLVYTSGTTGRPKGVELPPASFAGRRTVTDTWPSSGSSRSPQYGTHRVVGRCTRPVR